MDAAFCRTAQDKLKGFTAVGKLGRELIPHGFPH